MSYSQLQIDNFWWGTGGSAANIRPGAYATMSEDTVLGLTTRGGPGYDAGFSALYGYLYTEAVIKKSGIGPTGSDGFASKSTIES